MQFQVPQFIEVEDKIFGPLTFKQFIYMAGGAGAAYLLWRVLPLYLAGPLILGIGGLAAALAFLQWNGRPFVLGLENGFYYLVRSKLYLWSNELRSKQKTGKREQKIEPTSEVYIPKLAESKLHELAWSLDIKERIAAGVAEDREHVGGIVAPVRTAREALVQ
ncbi:PrgI family protein [Candidatus Kaiserbacteria bacterium]|nr:PrgI family protein [Candidatus Kaiserbacteria bacterium]